MKKEYIKRFDNQYTIDEEGNIFSFKSNRYLKPYISSKPNQYPRIKLSKNNKDYMFSVHRLVAETFLENKNNKPIVNHIDGNKNNYKLSNLEWVTHKENSKHSIEKGLLKINKGKKHHNTKLSEKDVVDIYHSKENYETISKRYSITKSTISRIKNETLWIALPKNKNIETYSRIKTNKEINEGFDHKYSKQIKNHNNYKIDIYGNILNIKTKYQLKTPERNGYLIIFLNGKTYNIHRLVAETFIENINNYKIVNHKDGNRKNNHISNLEWVTHKENSKHSIENNLKKIICGEKIGTSKLKENDVIDIFKSKLPYKKISDIYNISVSNISMIKNKKAWKNLTYNL